jgi:thiol-disulfide isomerase/thioredoxin
MRKIIATLLVTLFVTTASQAADETFNIQTIDGKMLRFKGIPEGLVTEPYQGKIVFIEFWGTWCGPCLLSIPHHVKLQEKYKDQLRIISFETTPSVTREQLKEYIKDPKNIDMKRVQWYLDNKAKTPAQKKSLEEPVHTLEAFRAAGKPINYDVVSSKDAGQFVDYIGQRAGWEGYIPFLLVLDGEGKAAAMVPGMPSEEKLDGIIQSILKKKK